MCAFPRLASFLRQGISRRKREGSKCVFFEKEQDRGTGMFVKNVVSLRNGKREMKRTKANDYGDKEDTLRVDGFPVDIDGELLLRGQDPFHRGGGARPPVPVFDTPH